MTKEQLMAAGLTEEQANAVLKLHKDSIDGNYVPKVTFEAERDKVKKLDEEVKTRDTQIAELGKFKGTAEDLQKKVSDLEKDNKEAKEKFDADIQKLSQESAVRTELTGKVIDIDDVLPKLDFAKISFKEGKIEKGLTEQLDELKKAKPHYFPADTQTPPKGWIFGTPPKEGNEGGTDNKDSASEFGKQLAQLRTSGDTIAAKAADHYFK